jgi:hypothetical protein
MDPVTLVRPNGSGFMHLQRQLQPGERVPNAPSMLNLLLACRLTHAEDQIGDNPADEQSEEIEEDF